MSHDDIAFHPELLASLEEAAQTRMDMIAAARLKLAFDQLVTTEGWKALQDYWLSRIEESRLALLDLDTSKDNALDKVRVWQLREKQWGELVSYINQCCAFEDAEQILLKEQLNA